MDLDELKMIDLGEYELSWNDKFHDWFFYWKFGSMRLRWFYPSDKENAEVIAKLFVFLWQKGIRCDLARDLAFC